MNAAPTSEQTIILLRHGVAVGAHPDGDRARPLAAGANEAVRDVARQIAVHAPMRAIVSPARRTRETFDAVREEIPALEATFEEAVYNAPADDLMRLLAGAGDGALVLIGHNPGITGAAHAMSGGAYADVMAPSDAVVVAWDVETGTGRLLQVVRADGRVEGR